MKRWKFFAIIIFFLFGAAACSCDKKSDSKQTKEPKAQETAPAFQNPTDYYKSLFTKNSVKDLEKRVFTGMTITERLGKTYIYSLPSGRQIKVAYSDKNNPLLFNIETVFGGNETHFKLQNDIEILKIREMDYLIMVFLNADGLFHILELSKDSLTSISNFMDKYGGTLHNQEFSKTDEAMQKKTDEFCRQFFENRYKAHKEDLKIDDIYRIYCKAMKKEK